MKRMIFVFASCIFALISSQAQSANDWPAFRGPEGNGLASGGMPPVRWSSSENIRWKQPIEGEGWSSPVVFGGRIFLTAAVAKSEGSTKSYSLRAMSLDLATGKQQWNVQVFEEDGESAPPIHQKNSHASPTPLVVGDRVYVHFGHQGTACLNLSGKLLWQNRDLSYPPVHGAGGTPILVDESLIFSCDGASDPFLVALDAKIGIVKWKVPRDSDAQKKFSFSTPTAIVVNGQRQVITPGSNVVNALDPATGDEIWRVKYEGYSVIPKPVFANRLVYVCTGYERPNLLAIRPDGRGDVTESHVVWRAESNVPHTPSVLVVGNELFMVSDNGIASCLDATTGEEVWRKRLGENFSASPIYSNGMVYFQSEEGTTTVIQAKRDYELVSANTIDERTFASPAVVGDWLLLRSNRHLYCIGE